MGLQRKASLTYAILAKAVNFDQNDPESRFEVSPSYCVLIEQSVGLCCPLVRSLLLWASVDLLGYVIL